MYHVCISQVGMSHQTLHDVDIDVSCVYIQFIHVI
jgi:hypothetical protein